MKWYGYIKNDKKRAQISLVTALIIALVLTAWLAVERGLLVEAKVQKAQEKLSGEVLRFHVLANSDSEKDQELKMQVKEAVLEYMKQEMPENSDVAKTREWAKSHLREIEDISSKTLKDSGSEYPVTAEITKDDFPEKTYGDVTFPAGEYEALRIKIGNARGHNWWCCLYPNLCFTDAVHAVVPDEGKEELKAVLDEEEYEMVTSTTNFKIKWFFFGDHSE